MYIRVHFAKTQVQLPLDQHSSFPRVYGISLPLPLPEDGEEGGRPKARGMERFVEGVVAKCMKQMTTAYVVRAIER